MARNILEQHVYSHATNAPFEPSLIRLPGYPLFLAAVYSIFGHYNNTAVRIVQALVDTAACALIGIIAFYWEADLERKRRASIAALALAAICPFTTIYVATILSETPTIFFAVVMTLVASLAFTATTLRRSVLLWIAAGLVAGLAVLFRPDSALFAAAIGLTLVITTLFLRRPEREVDSPGKRVWARLSIALLRGALFSLSFCLVLVPWTIRNRRVFHIFQPLAPAHAEMPGEFVPRGYYAWLRTWVDDQRYIETMLWSLDESPISLEEIPDKAFDSDEERDRVAALLEEYNHPPQAQSQDETQNPNQPLEDQANQDNSATAQPENNSADEGDAGDEQDEDAESDEGDEGDTADNNPEAQGEEYQAVELTPAIDAGFAQIARERISRAPFRYYVLLPLQRGAALWFDTHSQYYPFEGELFPLEDLDYAIHQQLWLPLFAGLTWLYTLLGIAGGWMLWQSREKRPWFLLAALMIFLRLAFFSTKENPEPRYVVEVFPFLSILGGIAVIRMTGLFRSLEKRLRSD